MSTVTTTSRFTGRPALHHRPGPRALLVAVGNEVDKGLRHAWSERLQILIEMPLFVSMALLFSLLLGQGQYVAATGHLASHLDPHRTAWIFLGFAAFTFAYLQVVKVFWRLLGEIQSGTLEQTYLTRCRPGPTSPSGGWSPPCSKPASSWRSCTG